MARTIRLLKPIQFQGDIVSPPKSITTNDSHARELIRKKLACDPTHEVPPKVRVRPGRAAGIPSSALPVAPVSQKRTANESKSGGKGKRKAS